VTATTGGAAGRRLPGAFVACLVYTVRVCVPPKRWALMALPTAGAVLFGLLARALTLESPEDGFNAVTGALFGLVLPFATLVIGDSVLGAERRSGALTLTWLSPVSFTTILLARFLAGWALTLVALVPAMALSPVVAGVPAGVGPMVVASAAGSAAYIALFVLIGIVTQRAALWSLGVVLLGEHLLGGVLSGIAQLSPYWLASGVYGGLGPDAEELVRDGVPSGWGGVVRLAVLTVVFLAISTWRLRHLRIGGPTD
jgi:ABC-2 type transport system permease protein